MNTIDRQVAHEYEARPPVGKILRAHGRILVVGITLSSLIAFGAYRIFDFNLIWVVAVSLVIGGVGLAAAVARS